MVLANSRRIPRAPRYSGYRYATSCFTYWTITVYGHIFQKCSVHNQCTMSRSYNPSIALRQHWFGLLRVRSPLLAESFDYFLLLRVKRCFSSPRSPRISAVSGLQPDGLPHSEIRGSRDICSYPRLIAACHVLLRLREPQASAVRSSFLLFFLSIALATLLFTAVARVAIHDYNTARRRTAALTHDNARSRYLLFRNNMSKIILPLKSKAMAVVDRTNYHAQKKDRGE